MPPRGAPQSNLMRPLVVLALPGMYLLYKYNQYRQQQMEATRKKVTERELSHLNTKIAPRKFSKEIYDYGKKATKTVCERKMPKKPTIFYKIKLKVLEGGSNFGTPFKWLQPKKKECAVVEAEPEALPAPVPRKLAPLPEERPGVQVSILGADTPVGQYVSLLLKQCPAIKRLRLYEAREGPITSCTRDITAVANDLQHINTNCDVQAFSCCYCELGRCLQNTDIVLMLESGYLTIDMPFNERFCYQAPIVRRYADAIAHECPMAFVVCCASPIDCMVPLIAETMKETGWYDPRKLLGSMAVPEMRASTLAARALSLEPRYTRVTCVGGTEGESLVPLFSKAVEHFDFTEQNAKMLTYSVRVLPTSLGQCQCCNVRCAELSEAHAIAKLVTKIAHALVENDVPKVTGFVESDCSQVISPVRYIASPLLLDNNGICRQLGLPKMNDLEKEQLDLAFMHLNEKLRLSEDWYCRYITCTTQFDHVQQNFFTPRSSGRFDDCAYSNV